MKRIDCADYLWLTSGRWVLSLTLLLVTTCLCDRAFANQTVDRPNVVIFFTDDQGTLDAGCYGSDDLHTPNIDSLASDGVRFTQAYAHTVCCPARAALLTGRHPQRGGVTFWTQGDMNGRDGINMRLEEETIAERLRANGYRTALFGKWHLGAHRDYGPMRQGFDEFFGIRDGFIDNFNHYFLHGNGYHDLYEGTTELDRDGEYFPELMIERALSFLDQDDDAPFFLYLPFNIPHYPEQALTAISDKYDEDDDHARPVYAAMIETTDDYIGRVLDKLDARGVREDTIIIFMSDNGHSNETNFRISVDDHLSGYQKGHFYGASGLGNTGIWRGHKGQFLEGGIRVPAIISYPSAVPSGEVRDQIITAMDWFPTILDLVNIDDEADSPWPEFDGFSLIPILESADEESQYEGELHFQWGNNWAVRKDEWKLIGRDQDRRVSLFRLDGEAPESEDFASTRPEIVERLRELHQAWAERVNE